MQVFLSSRPVWKEAAAQAARQAKNWRMALAIAQSEGKMDLRAFAAEIANELRYGTPEEALAASQIYVSPLHVKTDLLSDTDSLSHVRTSALSRGSWNTGKTRRLQCRSWWRPGSGTRRSARACG
jgi:hypothetical protein